MSETRKIGLFGGTFDPVHLGHLHLAGLARAALGLDQVRFLPCRISPHKGGREPAGVGDRLQMLRLATVDLDWTVVDDFEVLREGPSFSCETAEAMRERYPAARLFWILGEDQWQALPRWHQPERLAGLVEFVVFSRGGEPQPRPGYVAHFVAGGHPAAATAIRQAFIAGQASHPWLAPEVAAWIVKRNLYRGCSGVQGCR